MSQFISVFGFLVIIVRIISKLEVVNVGSRSLGKEMLVVLGALLGLICVAALAVLSIIYLIR